MAHKEPRWWYQPSRSPASLALEPAGLAYGAIAKARYQRAVPYRASIPVICVGNFTSGGTGKTPLSLHIAKRLKASGERPFFLSRGYGGSNAGPVAVNTEYHTAADVGDEPLLLQRVAPAVVARDRAAGAKAIEAAGATVIIMDDGLQNPSLAKDLSIAVVDAKRGLGNGRVIPAGPLRAPLSFQLGLCDAVVCMGGLCDDTLRKALGSKPLLSAQVETMGQVPWEPGQNVIAFAGIANPDRFFSSLKGANIVERVAFADHEMLSASSAQALLDAAARCKAQLVTTEKDWVRIPAQGGPFEALKRNVRVVAIEAKMLEGDQSKLDALIEAALKRTRRP